MTDFLLLSDGDGHATPFDSPCPECGKPVSVSGSDTEAYLAGGACLMLNDRVGSGSEQFREYLSVGVLGEKFPADRTDIELVNNLRGGQFHLQWCSIGCMRAWLLRLLAEVERRFTLAVDESPGTVDPGSGS